MTRSGAPAGPPSPYAPGCSQHVVGVDFGTLSGRAVIVRVGDGEELGSAVHEYAHGVLERTRPSTGEQLRLAAGL